MVSRFDCKNQLYKKFPLHILHRERESLTFFCGMYSSQFIKIWANWSTFWHFQFAVDKLLFPNFICFAQMKWNLELFKSSLKSYFKQNSIYFWISSSQLSLLLVQHFGKWWGTPILQVVKTEKIRACSYILGDTVLKVWQVEGKKNYCNKSLL